MTFASLPHMIRAAIFDFDYTLADSSEGVVDCVSFALDRLGIPSASGDDIRSTIGKSLDDTFLSLVPSEQHPAVEDLCELLKARADQVMADETTMPEDFDDFDTIGRIQSLTELPAVLRRRFSRSDTGVNSQKEPG